MSDVGGGGGNRKACRICLQPNLNEVLQESRQDDAKSKRTPNDSELCKRFIQFAIQHMEVDQELLNSPSFFIPSTCYKFEEAPRRHAGGQRFFTSFCLACRSNVRAICQLHQELCDIRLKLNLRVVALGEILEKSVAGKPKTRREHGRGDSHGGGVDDRKSRKLFATYCKMVAPFPELKVERMSEDFDAPNDDDEMEQEHDADFQNDDDDFVGNEVPLEFPELAMTESKPEDDPLQQNIPASRALSRLSRSVSRNNKGKNIKSKNEPPPPNSIEESSDNDDVPAPASRDGQEHQDEPESPKCASGRPDLDWKPPTRLQALKKESNRTAGTRVTINKTTRSRKQTYDVILEASDSDPEPEPESTNPRENDQLRPRKNLCAICFTVIALSDMGAHLKEHLGTDGWECRNCLRIYPTRFILLKHLSIKRICKSKPVCLNDPRRVFTCNVCLPETKFTEYSEFYDHIFSTHEKDLTLEKRHECQICQNKYRTESGLEFHNNVHIQLKAFRKYSKQSEIKRFFPPDASEVTPCKICKKVIANDSLEDHISSVHGTDKSDEIEIIKCTLCDGEKVCVNREDYLVHLHTRHKGELKPCHICWSQEGKKELFGNVQQIRDHMFNMHGVGDRFECQYCPATFLKKISWKAHVFTYHSETRSDVISCELCLKSGEKYRAFLTTKEGLENHMKRCHQDDQYKCTRCPAHFNCNFDFLEHEKNDHAGDPLLCFECGKQYVHFYMLKNHEKIHSESTKPAVKCKVFKCDVCEKVFHTRCSMKNHQKVHLKEKAYICAQCGKEFKWAESLKDHELCHLPGGKPKPFICEVCSRGFQDRKLLEQHTRIHTGERPFPCDICGSRFRQRSSFRTHQKSCGQGSTKTGVTFERKV